MTSPLRVEITSQAPWTPGLVWNAGYEIWAAAGWMGKDRPVTFVVKDVSFLARGSRSAAALGAGIMMAANILDDAVEGSGCSLMPKQTEGGDRE